MAERDEGKLVASVDSREEALSVFKVVQAHKMPVRGNECKEVFRCVVRGQSRRNDKPCSSLRAHELEERLGEHGVRVHIATAGQGEPPTRSQEQARGLRF